MKKIILFFLLCLPLLGYAQTDEKYLEGAITLKDGKVTFSTEMIVPAMTKEQIYETLLDWSNKRYQPTEKMNARVLFKIRKKAALPLEEKNTLYFLPLLYPWTEHAFITK